MGHYSDDYEYDDLKKRGLLKGSKYDPDVQSRKLPEAPVSCAQCGGKPLRYCYCSKCMETMISSQRYAPPMEPTCFGDAGECAYNGACLYDCGRAAPPAAQGERSTDAATALPHNTEKDDDNESDSGRARRLASEGDQEGTGSGQDVNRARLGGSGACEHDEGLLRPHTHEDRSGGNAARVIPSADAPTREDGAGVAFAPLVSSATPSDAECDAAIQAELRAANCLNQTVVFSWDRAFYRAGFRAGRQSSADALAALRELIGILEVASVMPEAIGKRLSIAWDDPALNRARAAITAMTKREGK